MSGKGRVVDCTMGAAETVICATTLSHVQLGQRLGDLGNLWVYYGCIVCRQIQKDKRWKGSWREERNPSPGLWLGGKDRKQKPGRLQMSPWKLDYSCNAKQTCVLICTGIRPQTRPSA